MDPLHAPYLSGSLCVQLVWLRRGVGHTERGDWVEVRSRHFALRTESNLDTAKRTVEELERFYDAFDRVAYPHDPKPMFTLDVVLFDDSNALDQLGYESNALMLQRTGSDLEDRFTFLTFGTLGSRSGPREYARFLHELAHRFTAFHFPSAPIWLDEGLSELFSTLEIDGQTVVLGEYLPDRVFVNGPWSFAGGRNPRVAVPIAAAPSIVQLQSYSRARFYGENISDDPSSNARRQEKILNYTSAWNLVHLLLLGEQDVRERFLVFLEALARGSNTATDSWKANFGPVAVSLESKYRQLLGQTTRNVARIPFQASPIASPVTRELSPAEVHLLWASVRKGDSPEQQAVRLADIQRAIELDPKLLAARMAFVVDLLDRQDFDRAERELAHARRLAPRDPVVLRAELQLAMQRGDEQAIDRTGPLLMKVARTAGEHALVSDYLLLRGKTVAAIRAAKAGLDADPGSWRCFAAIGNAYERMEDHESASGYLGMAVNMLGEADSRRQDLLKRLAAIESKKAK